MSWSQEKTAREGPLSCWRRGAESNRPGWICNPLHSRFAAAALQHCQWASEQLGQPASLEWSLHSQPNAAKIHTFAYTQAAEVLTWQQSSAEFS